MKQASFISIKLEKHIAPLRILSWLGN